MTNPILNISATSTDYNVDDEAQIIASGLTITDSNGGTLDGAKVIINNKLDGDFLGIVGQTGPSGTVEGLSWNYDESTGVLTLSGDADNSVYESALQQITYNNTSDTPDSTQRDIEFILGSSIRNPENGHFYEYVEAPNTNWTTAKSEAEAREYLGLQGYLATITSSEEQEYIENNILTDDNAWIGASDAATEGDWRWVTGPEAGTSFWSGNQNGNAVGNQYNNWSRTQAGQRLEPNNFPGSDQNPGEDYVQIQGIPLQGSSKGAWNDVTDIGPGGDYKVKGYLVEYGGLEGDPQLDFTGSITVNITTEDPDPDPVDPDPVDPNPSPGNPNQTPDFNGDNQPEILWRDFNAGNNEIWEVNYDGSNTTGPFSIDITNLKDLEDTNWRAEGVEDFNKDGIDDILWRNYATGENTIWLMKNGTDGIEFDQKFTINTVPGSQLEIESFADVTGNGTKDIVWRNYATGENAIWQINYDAANTQQPFSLDSTNTKFITSVSDPNWKIVESGDFNNDNISDLLWRNDSTGQNAIWLMKNDPNNGPSLDTSYFLNDVNDLNWKIEGVADFNQDGNDDILWRNYSTGENAVWLMEQESSLGAEVVDNTGLTVTWRQRNSDGSIQTPRNAGSGVFLAPNQDLAWDIEGVADYTKDGTPDILWRNYGTGENAIWEIGSNANGINAVEYSIGSKALAWQIESPTTNNDYVAV